MSTQLTLNFEAGLTDCYSSCRECVQSLAHQQGQPVKAIAADMDYSPSTFSRKLAQSPNDSQRFTLDDLEAFIRITGDMRPLFYLVEKYISKTTSEKEQLLARLAEIDRQTYNEKLA